MCQYIQSARKSLGSLMKRADFGQAERAVARIPRHGEAIHEISSGLLLVELRQFQAMQDGLLWTMQARLDKLLFQPGFAEQHQPHQLQGLPRVARQLEQLLERSRRKQMRIIDGDDHLLGTVLHRLKVPEQIGAEAFRRGILILTETFARLHQ